MTTKLEDLAREVATHADQLSETLRELGTSELQTGAGTLHRRYIRTNIGSYHSLGWEDGGDLTLGIVSVDGDEGRYIHNDFHSWVSAPSAAELFRYAENQSAIDTALAEYREQQEQRISQAMNALAE